MEIALGIAGVVGGVVIAMLGIRNGGLKSKLANVLAQRDRLRDDAARLSDALQQASEEYKALDERLNGVIASYRTEIKELEREMAECLLPGAVRDRLERLLQAPTSDDG